MRLLLDTHIVLWAMDTPEQLSATARALIANTENELYFSVVTLWEIAIKNSTPKRLNIDTLLLRDGLLRNEYQELNVEAAHAMAVAALPWIHKDPFDRILIAQAQVEGLVLVTADTAVQRYPGLQCRRV